MKLTKLLDPREISDPAIRDSVHIPAREFNARSHELPSKNEVVLVPRVPGSEVALKALEQSGRQARLTQDFQYGGGDPCRLWSPTKFLEESLPGLAGSHALDIACGTGRDAVYLASKGWDVSAVDVLPDALIRARDLAARYAPTRSVNWIEANVESESFDPRGSYDLITMFLFFDLDVLRRSAGWLSEGGVLLVESFSKEHQLATGHPRTLGRAIRRESVEAALSSFELSFQTVGPMMRILARRLPSERAPQ